MGFKRKGQGADRGAGPASLEQAGAGRHDGVLVAVLHPWRAYDAERDQRDAAAIGGTGRVVAAARQSVAGQYDFLDSHPADPASGDHENDRSGPQSNPADVYDVGKHLRGSGVGCGGAARGPGRQLGDLVHRRYVQFRLRRFGTFRQSAGAGSAGGDTGAIGCRFLADLEGDRRDCAGSRQ